MNTRTLHTVRASALADLTVPQRRWIVPGFIPDRTVTILGGDGGTGKSLVTLQLAVAMATSTPWLGLQTSPGKAIVLSAEDELDEIHRRLHQICFRREIRMEALTQLSIIPLAGKSALLVTQDRSRATTQTTPLWEALREVLTETRPKMLIIDTLADVFGGDEINRVQTRTFIGLLRGLALEFDVAIVLLAHPSLSGMSSGSGSSGSTAWSNSVRSRLYFERVKEDGDGGNGRVLSTKKANYAAVGSQVKVRWRDGVFENELANPNPEKAEVLRASEAKIDGLFLKLLTEVVAHGRSVSPNPSASYAPTFFETLADGAGTKAKAFAAAMERLLKADAIHIALSGPPSKRRSQLLPGKSPDRETVVTSPVEGPTDFSVDADAAPRMQHVGAT
jgi:RecA-family ATPase